MRDSYLRFITHEKGGMEWALRKSNVVKKKPFLRKRQREFYFERSDDGRLRLRKGIKYRRVPNRSKGYLVVTRVHECGVGD